MSMDHIHEPYFARKHVCIHKYSCQLMLCTCNYENVSDYAHHTWMSLDLCN